MRSCWITLVVVPGGCRVDAPSAASHAASPVAASSTAGPAAVPEVAVAQHGAPEAIADEPGAAEPTAPEPEDERHARCTGVWTATASYGRTQTCRPDQLAPYHDLELAVVAGASGWEVSLLGPAAATDFALRWLDVDWDDDNGWCKVDVTFSRGTKGELLSLELVRGSLFRPDDRAPTVSARVDLLDDDDEDCMGDSAREPATLVPDAGNLPPVHPWLVGVAGTLELAIAWPKLECPVKPKGAYRLEATVDRAHGDRLVVEGLEWETEPVQLRSSRTTTALRLSAHRPLDGDPYGHVGVLELDLDVEGESVTGEARFGTPSADIDVERVPCREVSAKVRGTRHPASLGG